MTNILGVGGNRLVWADLPDHVRTGIEGVLGAPVVETTSEPGGFSPGLAARVVLADGRRMFVKAVNSSRNVESVRLLSNEARILTELADVDLRPPVVVPALRGQYVHGDWIALVITEVDGRTPAIPWRTAELDRVVDAVQTLGECLTPAPLAVPAVTQAYATVMNQWRTLAGGREMPAGLPPWAVSNLNRLAELEADWPAAAAGNTLLHLDLRADNLLLGDDQVFVVDWPHACVGAAWVDLLVMLPSVIMQGGDPERCWRRYPAGRDVAADQVNAVLAALAGYFAVSATRPAPPELPRLREFQRAQGDAALSWLRERVALR
jgi:aminoglycoside phosphotransferase (APT) family kinase protein